MKYLDTSPEKDRLLAQEQFVLDTTEAICAVMAEQDVTRAELARRLEVTPAEVTQRLNGERNLTLRSVAEMFHALGLQPTIAYAKSPAPNPSQRKTSVA